MVEYLYNAVIASAGEQIGISAQLTNCGKPYTEGCTLQLFSKEGNQLTSVVGDYIPEMELWSFKIPAEVTKDLIGRYWYQISSPDMSLCFKQPIYLK